jgi:hypothetical protein
MSRSIVIAIVEELCDSDYEISSSFMGDTVVLQNLSLRPDLFPPSFPFALKACCVGKVTIEAPLRSLSKGAVKITVEDVLVDLALRTGNETGADPEAAIKESIIDRLKKATGYNRFGFIAERMVMNFSLELRRMMIQIEGLPGEASLVFFEYERPLTSHYLL